MKKLLLIFILIFVASAAFAQSHPEPNHVAQGAEKVTHEQTHPTEGHGEGEHAPKTYFGIPGWILKLINMIAFFALLIYLVRKPIAQTFNQRRENINTALEEAEARRKKSDQLASDIEARLKQIEGEVASIIQRAREEGERQKQELIAAADVEAQKILTSARTEVDTKLKAARQELTAYARELATDRARQLVETSLTDADRHRLFEESFNEVSGVRS
jgi:F-type H+-transporting ATPase subunit b